MSCWQAPTWLARRPLPFRFRERPGRQAMKPSLLMFTLRGPKNGATFGNQTSFAHVCPRKSPFCWFMFQLEQNQKTFINGAEYVSLG